MKGGAFVGKYSMVIATILTSICILLSGAYWRFSIRGGGLLARVREEIFLSTTRSGRCSTPNKPVLRK